jgi:mannose-6-phosphate isomerase
MDLHAPLDLPLRLRPIAAPMVWGGRRLCADLGKPFDPQAAVGESWELSDLPERRTTIAGGPLDGAPFGDWLRSHRRSSSPFPLLVKFIDARESLSIQVHPDDERAPPGRRGKTECWYVLDCPGDGAVLCGVRSGVDRESFLRAAESGAIESSIERVAIRPGSFVYVPAGTVHAILAGTLLCEIQQASDATYRIWDWGRKPPRPLHLDRAMEVARFPSDPPGPDGPPCVKSTAEWPAGVHALVRNRFFEVRLAVFGASDARAALDGAESAESVVVVVAGSGRWFFGPDEADGAELRAGDTFYVPDGLGPPRLTAGPSGLRLLLARPHH